MKEFLIIDFIIAVIAVFLGVYELLAVIIGIFIMAIFMGIVEKINN